ncbi:MAG: signal peptidase I [Actinomycetota bacterium]|nr:signal peptidase I [Actinomycetota bacterium]
MTGKRGDEVPESRRELRQERPGKRKLGSLAEFLVRRRASGSSKKLDAHLFWEDGAPKSRRALRQERRWRKRRVGFSELFITIGVALIVVFGFVRPFVVESFRIPSESMIPTLEVGDRVLANKFVYRFAGPERGDIVVFEGVGGEDPALIKRVVGVTGDEIRVQDGALLVNGEPQEEPYLNEESPSRDFYGPVTVPEGHVFLMGDNRGNSSDSRVFGPVPLENLKGEAFFRFWPISKIEPL